jgi:hypothetical protein
VGTPTLLRVSWVEHYVAIDDAWYDDAMVSEELDGTERAFFTVGYLVRETPTHLVLADTIAPDGTYSRPWIIAKGTVSERVELGPTQQGAA